jgi:hypothetical protein
MDHFTMKQSGAADGPHLYRLSDPSGALQGFSSALELIG